MSVPQVSVLMPVYNARRFVAEAIQSVLNQTFTDFEFIIIEDGSTDGSLKILQQYAAMDSRIRLVSRPNTGYVRALNEALAMAKGELIARMDADDVCFPCRFERQVEFMRAHPEVVLMGSATELIDGAGRLLLRPPVATTDAELQAGLIEGKSGIGHPTAMLRREQMLAAGGYHVDMCPAEDLDLWLRLSEVGKLANLPEPLIKYRIHDKSVSSKHQMTQVQSSFRACEEAWKRRGITNMKFDWARRWRADPSRKSRYQFLIQYGWWAFNSAERTGALLYGLRALALIPWQTAGWRLVACAVLKPVTRPS